MNQSSSDNILVQKQITLTDTQLKLLENESKVYGGSINSVVRHIIVEHYKAKGEL